MAGEGFDAHVCAMSSFIPGRRSVLMRARNEACEALRDATTRCQGADIAEAGEPAQKAIDAAQRLIEVAGLWGHVK